MTVLNEFAERFRHVYPWPTDWNMVGGVSWNLRVERRNNIAHVELNGARFSDKPRELIHEAWDAVDRMFNEKGDYNEATHTNAG